MAPETRMRLRGLLISLIALFLAWGTLLVELNIQADPRVVPRYTYITLWIATVMATLACLIAGLGGKRLPTFAAIGAILTVVASELSIALASSEAWSYWAP